MSGVEDPSKIDLVTFDPARDEYILVLVEPRPWDGSEERARQLITKVDNYRFFVSSGQLAKNYPESVGKAVRLQLDCDDIPDLGKCRAQGRDEGGDQRQPRDTDHQLGRRRNGQRGHHPDERACAAAACADRLVHALPATRRGERGRDRAHRPELAESPAPNGARQPRGLVHSDSRNARISRRRRAHAGAADRFRRR